MPCFLRCSRVLFCFSMFLGIMSCGGPSEAELIIRDSIRAHGGERFEESEIRFDFRGDTYVIRILGGLFQYERLYESEDALVRDVMSNDSLFREVDGDPVALTDQDRTAIESRVNSVAYFSLLPYRLEDPAVQARYLGESSIGGEAYHKVEVTFQPEGGGRDWEDRFVYWFNKETNLLHFLAYRYFTGEGGTRFREVVNRYEAGGLILNDYANYTVEGIEDIEQYEQFLDREQLEFVSEIALENIEVSPAREESFARPDVRR